MKKLAARDFEDLLQCILPVIEDLLPNRGHARAILDLIFTLAEWHAVAKLRIHTTSTIARLRELTHAFGIRLRHFANHICPEYDTKELPKEEAARLRRQAKQRASQTGTSSTPVTEPASVTNAPNKSPTKTAKRFTLSTYKLHAMGDYANHIERYGSTDSFSTQSVSCEFALIGIILPNSDWYPYQGELEHRSVKRYYTRTNKIHPTRQIARIHRRERVLQKALNGHFRSRATRADTKARKSLYQEHHYISSSRNFPIRLSPWLSLNCQNPHFKVGAY